MGLVGISHAIGNYAENRNASELARAVEKVPAKILNDICAGIYYEDGEDVIDSEEFRYGLEIAESYDTHKVIEIRQILGG